MYSIINLLTHLLLALFENLLFCLQFRGKLLSKFSIGPMADEHFLSLLFLSSSVSALSGFKYKCHPLCLMPASILIVM